MLNPIAPAEPHKSGRCKDDCVVSAGVQLCDAGIQVAPEISHVQIRASGPQLRGPAERAGANPCPGGESGESSLGTGPAYQSIPWVLAASHGGEHQASREARGDVFERMHRQIGGTFQQCDVQLLGEEPTVPDLCKWYIEKPITRTLHNLDLDREVRVGSA